MNAPTTDYPPLSPYLSVRDAVQAIAFYQAAFGATERFRLTDKKIGKIGHAELMIEGCLVMIAEENPQWGNKSPATLGGTSTTFVLIVKDTDAALARAVAAGATVRMPATDQFYGFRSANVIDPFGHQWMLQHQIEKISPAEMQTRWDAMTGDCPGAADAKK